MKKYHRRRHYSQNGEIKSFRELVAAILMICISVPLLFLMPYILTAYIYIIEHPNTLIPIGIFNLCMLGLIVYYKIRSNKIQMRAVTRFSEVMQLDWREFEEFVAEMLKEKGFTTLLGVGIKDGGVDITAILDDKKFFVQCKHYRGENIGVEKIRELHGVMTGEMIPVGGIFVTTTGFTADAVSEAKKYRIDLWDRNYIIDYLKGDSIIPQKEVQNTDVCEPCGGHLILRTAQSGEHAGEQFLGCENFPKCHYIRNL